MQTETPTHEPTTLWNKNFICVTLANLMMCMGHASVNPYVATYTKYLNTSPQLTGFLAGMFYGVSILIKPFSGPAMTKLDKRNLLIIAFAMGVVANIGYALFHNVPAFMIFRVFSGIQYGFFGALTITICANSLPRDKMASGIGIFGVGGSVGLALAPWLGESFLKLGTNLGGEALGFRLMFLFGALWFILGIIPSVVIDREKESREAITGTGAWYRNIFSLHALPATIMLFLCWLSYSFINTYIFEFSKQYGIMGVSLFFLVLAVFLAALRPLCGILIDRIGIPKTILPAFALFIVAMVVLGGSRSLAMLLIGAVLTAAGFGASLATLQPMAMQSEPVVRRGVAGNTTYLGIDMGLFLGPYIGGLVYAQSADYSVLFRVGAIPPVLAMVCFAVILPIYKRRMKEMENM